MLDALFVIMLLTLLAVAGGMILAWDGRRRLRREDAGRARARATESGEHGGRLLAQVEHDLLGLHGVTRCDAHGDHHAFLDTLPEVGDP